MATSISVPGGSGAPPLIFTVTGVSTTNYATDFQNAVNAAGTAATLTVDVLSSGVPQSSGSGTTLNEIFSTGSTSSYTLQTGGQYTLALVGSATTINGSTAGSDTVVAGGDVTFTAGGPGELITFVSGTNLFVGDAATGDTITGGAGYDTIMTGSSASTVFSGAGHTEIDLNGSGDVAYLGDGHSTVNALGTNATVVAGTNGQTIFGGSGNLLVDIMDNATSSGAAGDAIVAGSGNTTVFDSVGGSSIFGGSGSLTFVGQTGSTTMADSIVAGSGTTAIFGASGDDIVFSSTSASGSVSVNAGTGNETLNGANAVDFGFFASTDTSTSVSLQVVGGSGSDYFATGSGVEDYVAGSGADVFGLNTVGSAAQITIYDFSAADSVSFLGQSQSDVDNALGTGTVTGGNYTITLSDQTTVTFVGITSLTGHII